MTEGIYNALAIVYAHPASRTAIEQARLQNHSAEQIVQSIQESLENRLAGIISRSKMSPADKLKEFGISPKDLEAYGISLPTRGPILAESIQIGQRIRQIESLQHVLSNDGLDVYLSMLPDESAFSAGMKLTEHGTILPDEAACRAHKTLTSLTGKYRFRMLS